MMERRHPGQLFLEPKLILKALKIKDLPSFDLLINRVCLYVKLAAKYKEERATTRVDHRELFLFHGRDHHGK